MSEGRTTAADGAKQRDRELRAFLDGTERAPSKLELIAAFEQFMRRQRFHDYVCMRLRDLRRLDDDSILLCSRGDSWWRAYRASGVHHYNPILKVVQDRRTFAWSDVLDNATMDKKERECMELAYRYGVRNALVVAVSEPEGDAQGVFSIGSPNIEFNVVVREQLRLAIEAFYKSLAKFIRAEFQFTSQLTPREIEILRWVSEGKSDWQIGKILGISAKTVNYHTENVKRKFDVTTRIQAVMRAVQSKALSI